MARKCKVVIEDDWIEAEKKKWNAKNIPMEEIKRLEENGVELHWTSPCFPRVVYEILPDSDHGKFFLSMLKLWLDVPVRVEFTFIGGGYFPDPSLPVKKT